MVKPFPPPPPDSREKILDAARVVFHRAGFDGARMQDIADNARINKALLHYYFRSKDELFEAVFQESFRTNFQPIIEVMQLDLPLEEKVTRFVNAYISTIQIHPYIPGFVIHELNRNPDRMAAMAVSMNRTAVASFIEQLKLGMDAGLYRSMDPRQALVSLLSMMLFPFIAAPVVKGMFNLDVVAYHHVIEARKVEIPRMFFAMIKQG
jgi:TetR/AcrR family transcriptional regulator